MSEGLIFLHVDGKGETGYGTLYTSGSLGVIYTKSLEKHLYPKSIFSKVTDFYRVLSMDGVYLASQILEDKTLTTVISYDRGAKWERIKQPDGAECKKEPCNLQVYNSFSKSKDVIGAEPISIANAPGLIIVHGHVAASLQNTPPDVFISNNGGYSFFLVS